MDTISYIFYRLGKAILQVWSISFTICGYRVTYGSIIIWTFACCLIIRFLKNLSE